MSIKALLIGSEGRMGQEIRSVIEEDPEVTLAACFTSESSWDDVPEDIDVAIDFTHANFFDEVLSFCEKRGLNLVSGTTGISVQQKERIQSLGKKSAVLWAANMSLGVALLNRFILAFKNSSDDYKFQITETHHVHKKDSPSGTALWLQNTLESVVGPCPAPEATREGEVFGIHSLEARNDQEVITIKHEALNRTIFAQGAVRAAKWLMGQSKGQYELTDIL